MGIPFFKQINKTYICTLFTTTIRIYFYLKYFQRILFFKKMLDSNILTTLTVCSPVQKGNGSEFDFP